MLHSNPAPPSKNMPDCPNINKCAFTIRAGEFQIAQRLRKGSISLKYVKSVQEAVLELNKRYVCIHYYNPLYWHCHYN